MHLLLLRWVLPALAVRQEHTQSGVRDYSSSNGKEKLMQTCVA